MRAHNSLGLEFTRLRWSSGYSVTRLSVETGVTAGLIRMLEQGSRDVPLLEAIKLFAHLNYDFIQIYSNLATKLDENSVEKTPLTTFREAGLRREQIFWRLRSSLKNARRTLASNKKLVEDSRQLQIRAELALATFRLTHGR